MGAEKTEGPKQPLYCSFCAKSQHEVQKLIAGPAVFICDGCTALCADIVAMGYEEAMAAAAEHTKGYLSPPESWSTERHLRLLEAREQLAEAARASLQSTVDILRGREVSWAVIGGALGVSRQAAWERFG